MYLYANNHAPIDVHFSKNSSDFVVREIPLYDFSGSGEHLVLHIQKKDLNTQDALKILSNFTGAKIKDFGYAGLKDKQGLTTQYISMPAKFEANLSNFSHEKMKILNITKHNNKIKIGHLKGNSFFIRLKKVNPTNAEKISQIFNKIKEEGFANYYGYQRFGKEQNNAATGLEILKNELKFKNQKINKFLINAFQSELFNTYLSKRIELSRFASDFSLAELKALYKDEQLAKNLKAQKQFFKLFDNEIYEHYPYGKVFCENLANANERFLARDISPSGLILGKNPRFNEGFLGDLEREIYAPYIDLLANQSGSRRYLWSFTQDERLNYNPELAQLSLEFSLQKGSYATVILDEIIKYERNTK